MRPRTLEMTRLRRVHYWPIRCDGDPACCIIYRFVATDVWRVTEGRKYDRFYSAILGYVNLSEEANTKLGELHVEVSDERSWWCKKRRNWKRLNVSDKIIYSLKYCNWFEKVIYSYFHGYSLLFLLQFTTFSHWSNSYRLQRARLVSCGFRIVLSSHRNFIASGVQRESSRSSYHGRCGAQLL